MSEEDTDSTHRARVGSVEAIHVATGTGGQPEGRESVAAVAGRGIEGDRYFEGAGVYNERDELDPSDITLVESEALSAAADAYGVDLTDGEHRRNVTTHDVALNHLVGRQFRLGEAVVEGVSLCEPCDYMESLAEQPDAKRALVHRGGLDARIVDSGEIRVGDDVVW